MQFSTNALLVNNFVKASLFGRSGRVIEYIMRTFNSPENLWLITNPQVEYSISESSTQLGISRKCVFRVYTYRKLYSYMVVSNPNSFTRYINSSNPL